LVGEEKSALPAENRAMFRGDEGTLLREEGQTMAEYGVTLAVITPVVIIAFALLSGRIFDTVARAVDLIP
jgi:Flp pilus assembly pilin Flp